MSMMMEFRSAYYPAPWLPKHDSMLELLIAPTAAAGALDQSGTYGTALMLAMGPGMVDANGIKQCDPAVHKLLEAGAKPEIAGKCGGTLLSYAISQQHEVAAEKLIPLIAAAGLLDTFSVFPVCLFVCDSEGGWPT